MVDNEVTAKSMADNTITVKFDDSKIPEFKEVKGKQFVYFGEDNLYPDYLVKLYNKSAKHNAIINGKVNYIYGEGFYTNVNDPLADKFIFKVNSAGESLNDISKKCAIDIEIFGGFYLNLIPNKIGTEIAEIYHLDFNRVRANEDGSQFFYKNDWSNNKEKPKEYAAFNPNKLDKATIFQFKEYRPGLRTYPLPNYIGSINYIEADMEVSKHTLTNAKTGFSASKMVNFFNGEPAPEMQRDIYKRLEKKFTGADGSKMVVTFNNDPSKAPTILDLGASDLTKEDFEKVDNLIASNIFAGHQITSPMLFGIQEPGKLGGRNELRMSYEIFNNTYVSVKQRTLEKVFNYIAKFKGIKNEMYIRSVDPVGVEFTDVTLLQAAPRSWLLEKMGIDTTKYSDPPVGDKTMPPQPPTPPGDVPAVAAPNKLSKEFKEEEVAMMFGEVGDDTKQFHTVFTREVDFKSDAELAAHELNFYQKEMFSTLKTISDIETQVLKQIEKDKRISPAQVAQALGIDESYASQLMNDLHERGLVQYDYVVENGEKVAIKKLTKSLPQMVGEIKAKLPEIFIRYSYRVRPGLGASLKATSRPFCRKMVELSQTKVWSRSQIEQISQRVGYSVWDREGGFWNQGKGKGVSAHCRHQWVSQVLIKK
jgi:ribosomal protein S25